MNFSHSIQLLLCCLLLVTIAEAQSYQHRIAQVRLPDPYQHRFSLTMAGHHNKLNRYYGVIATSKIKTKNSYSAYAFNPTTQQWQDLPALKELDNIEYISYNRGQTGHFYCQKGKTEYFYDVENQKKYEVKNAGKNFQRSGNPVYYNNSIFQLGHTFVNGKVNHNQGLLYARSLAGYSAGTTINLSAEINKQILKLGYKENCWGLSEFIPLHGDYYFVTFLYNKSLKREAAIVQLTEYKGTYKLVSIKLLYRNTAKVGNLRFYPGSGELYLDHSSSGQFNTSVFRYNGALKASYSGTVKANFLIGKLGAGDYFLGTVGEVLYDKKSKKDYTNTWQFRRSSEDWQVKCLVSGRQSYYVFHAIAFEKQ